MSSLAAQKISSNFSDVLSRFGNNNFSTACRGLLVVDIPNTSSGSAVIISPDGGILTAKHVIEGREDNVFVSPLLMDQPRWIKAKVIKAADDVDLALLLIPELFGDREYSTTKIATKPSAAAEDIYTLGFGSLLSGGQVIGCTNQSEFLPLPDVLGSSGHYVLVSSPSREADSGGKLVNSKAEMIGVTIETFLKMIRVNCQGFSPEEQERILDELGVKVVNEMFGDKVRSTGINLKEPLGGITRAVTIEKIIPFLDACGIDEYAFLDSKPIRSSLKSY